MVRCRRVSSPSCWRRASTIGWAGLVSSCSSATLSSHNDRAVSRSLTMTAKGLSSRCLRARRQAAAVLR